jgi:hypothetical protein
LSIHGTDASAFLLSNFDPLPGFAAAAALRRQQTNSIRIETYP